VPVLLVAAGVLLSFLGWSTAYRVTAVEATAATSERAQDLADGRLEHVQDQRDGLRALVVQQCDAGQVTDRALCDAARRIVPAR
jgi:hypothetical protein